MCSNCHAPWQTGPAHGSFDYLGTSHSGGDMEAGIVITYNSGAGPNGSYSRNIGYY
ncbi:hypothetical protein HY772_06705 [Candidatus Woesearchaeota archaeon]|nr:hypothetical protein [Candidatus Woesearchaeota archaeon]